MRNPPGKRHRPWAFEARDWISAQIADDINTILSPKAHRKDSEKALSQAGRKLIQKHPELLNIVPILLEHSDPAGCKLAMQLAAIIKTPEMLSALKTFTLGQRGSDDLRMEASNLLSQAGAAPTGPVRMWIKGAWQDILHMGFEITGDAQPSVPHSHKVEQLVINAVLAIHDGKLDHAEELLKQAIQIEPESPDVLNNLAGVYNMTNREKEARELIFDLHRRFPDYFFGITNVAQILAHDGKPEEAEEILKPLLALKQLHTSEFSALCQAQIQMWLAKNNPDGARSWLQMWEQIDPAHPMIETYRQRVEKSNIWQRVLSRLR